jgi:hypothetical protein
MANLAASARLRLRVAKGQQAAAFAVTLPAGVLPWLHTLMPHQLRVRCENLGRGAGDVAPHDCSGVRAVAVRDRVPAPPRSARPWASTLFTGATVCADPISWFTRAKLTASPSIYVEGKPGTGKSTMVGRMLTYAAATGVTRWCSQT